MKDIKNIIKRLLSLSELILEEMDALEILSYYNRENTPDFDKHINTVSMLLNQEKVILNNLSIDEVKEIYKILPSYDNDTDEFDRCSINISDKLDNIIDEEYNDIDIEEEYESDTTEDDILEKYMVETDISAKDTVKIINNLATVVIKKMLKRIDMTSTDNKNDYKYKKKLMRYFNKFKYYYFKLDINLENLGVKCRFNVDKIPTPFKIDKDYSSLSNNECVTLLDKLYTFRNNDFDLEDMSFGLFNMMLFDEFSKELSDEDINNLIMLCEDLKNKYGDSLYGDIAYKKLIRKKN